MPSTKKPKKKNKKPGKRGRPPKPKAKRKKIIRDVLYRIDALDRFFREQLRDPNPARRFLSYRELALKFGWGKNTVIRDIATMKLNYNAPLDSIKERGGWGYTQNVANLPTIFISEGDLTVLCASWGALERRRNTKWGNRVRPVMEKLMKAMGHGFSYDLSTISERIVFRASGYQDALDIGIFETVVAAVLGQQELRFVYRKTLDDGSISEPETRHVQPRCIVVAENAFYLIADDPSRDGKSRTFALFRMDSAENTGIDFTPSGPFNLDEILKDSLGIHRGGEVAPVELFFQPCVARFAREQYWHETQRFSTAPDGRLKLEMTVAMNPELEMKIQRWGSKVEVAAPASLREKFVEHTRELVRTYL